MANALVTIRPETPADADAIAGVIRAAFSGERSQGRSEVAIVEALRRDGALALSLVAEDDGRIVGHAAFSRVSISDGSPGWFGLGPLAVLASRQGVGIGSRLALAGFESLRQVGAAGCVVLGDPSFYRRLGFAPEPRLQLSGHAPENFLVIAFRPDLSEGIVSYHHAFDDPV